jgi:hypothetical protein
VGDQFVLFVGNRYLDDHQAFAEFQKARGAGNRPFWVVAMAELEAGPNVSFADKPAHRSFSAMAAQLVKIGNNNRRLK